MGNLIPSIAQVNQSVPLLHDLSAPQLTALIAAGFNLILTCFVLSQDIPKSLKRVYLSWGVAVVLWNCAAFVCFKEQMPIATPTLWLKLLQLGVIFAPLSFFHLCILTTQVRVPYLIPTLYWIHGLFAISLVTDLFVRGVRVVMVSDRFVGHWTEAGPLFYVYSFFFVGLIVSGTAILYVKQRSAPTLLRRRMRSFILAFGILSICGTNDVLPIYQLEHLIPFYPLGNLASVFYGIIIGYSVLQHQLMDINFTLGKIAAHIMRLAFVIVTGLLLLLIVALFTNAGGDFTDLKFPLASVLGVLIGSATIASVFFPRFFGRAEDELERYIVGDQFESRDKVQVFLQEMQNITSMDHLLDEMDVLLVKTVGVSRYQLIMIEENSRVFALKKSYPHEPPKTLSEFHHESPLFELHRERSFSQLAISVSYALPGASPLEEAARDQLKMFQPDFCFPLSVEDEPFGFLLVGEKSNNNPYTPADIKLLSNLVKNFASVANQIRLKNKVFLAEEMELLGRMSRGMAHDLNNLLTPVSTFLQLCNDSSPPRSVTEELLPVAVRNIGTMESYIKEALFFSQNHTLQIQPSRLDLLLTKAVDLAAPKLNRKEIEADVTSPEDVYAEIDPVLIQRLISNLLSNAIDASPKRSKIKLTLERLSLTRDSSLWYRIQVIDQGEGISEKNLRRIKVGYFTTKDTGSEVRGFGLGVAICRKIVHLHNANININSEVDVGTTVQVDLPSWQPEETSKEQVNLK